MLSSKGIPPSSLVSSCTSHTAALSEVIQQTNGASQEMEVIRMEKSGWRERESNYTYTYAERQTTLYPGLSIFFKVAHIHKNSVHMSDTRPIRSYWLTLSRLVGHPYRESGHRSMSADSAVGGGQLPVAERPGQRLSWWWAGALHSSALQHQHKYAHCKR